MPEPNCDNSENLEAAQSGQIHIHDAAFIAESAMLQALPDCTIEIESGAAIGEGCWLQACSGDITIEAGAVLGSGVLIVGWGQVGAFSTLGASVTVFETSIESGSAIAAHTVLGIQGQSVDLEESAIDMTDEVDNLPDPWEEKLQAEARSPTPPEEEDMTDNAEREKNRPPLPSHSIEPDPLEVPKLEESEGSEEREKTGDIELATESEEATLSEASDETGESDLEMTVDRAETATEISNPQTVYGRQHVDRILDRILQRKSI